jgi:hypothetical protein
MREKIRKNGSVDTVIPSSKPDIPKFSNGRQTSLAALSQFVDFLKREHNLTDQQIQDALFSQKPTGAIPVSIFDNQELTAFEAIVKYLHENLNQTYDQIAESLNRGKTTIAVTYKRAQDKKPTQFPVTYSKYLIPLSLFTARKFSVLEIVVKYLKEQKLSNHEIGGLLHRDDRTIWTVISRLQKKQAKLKLNETKK